MFLASLEKHKQITNIIIQQIVTLSKYGHDSLNILTDFLRYT